MTDITETNWYTHTFTPWHVHGDRRIVASESVWRAMESLGRCAAKFDERFRMLVKVDVFEDWDGLMVDKDGGILHRGEDWHSEKLWVSVRGMFIGKSRLRIDDVRRHLFTLIDATPDLDWLMVANQPENAAKMIPPKCDFCSGFNRLRDTNRCQCGGIETVRPNVWLGATVSGPDDLWRIPHLLKVPAKVRFLLMDPLLKEPGTLNLDGIHWVIVGGESGKGARAFNLAWARSIRDQCRAAGVPFFMKQTGKHYFSGDNNHSHIFAKDSKGADPAEWPEDLRVREVPGKP